ncbi:RNA polymerase sigma factor [Candidatus Kaiserbacteria bacterium]|nr:RNA polymerase sigma factor [Candidatus Kaiserbacteria bacterium]
MVLTKLKTPPQPTTNRLIAFILQTAPSGAVCNNVQATMYYTKTATVLMYTETDTDEAIVAAVQTGTVDAFGEIVTRYETKMQRYARRFLSRQEDIDDLVQDVFIKVYENIQSFDTTLRFSPWIYRIAHNVFVNELKRKSRYTLPSFDPDVILPFIPAKETADAEALATELSDEMESLVTALSAKYREVLVLHYFEHLSYQEMSDVLQIPTTTVGVRMTRAREKLQAAYYEKHPKEHV